MIISILLMNFSTNTVRRNYRRFTPTRAWAHFFVKKWENVETSDCIFVQVYAKFVGKTQYSPNASNQAIIMIELRRIFRPDTCRNAQA